MRVVVPFFIRMPGTRINLADRPQAFEIDSALRRCSASLTDAALALGGYLGTRQGGPRPPDSIDSGARAAIERAVRHEREIATYDYPDYDEVCALVDLRLLAQMYAAGQLPDSMARRLPVTYARAFLYALDEFRRHLDALKRFKPIEEQVTSARIAFAALVPDLFEVEHSLAYADGRAPLKGPWNAQLALEPVPASTVDAPHSGAPMMDCIDAGDIYSTTMADGNLRGVPVTPHTLARSVFIFQALLDGIPWDGSPRIEPQV